MFGIVEALDPKGLLGNAAFEEYLKYGRIKRSYERSANKKKIFGKDYLTCSGNTLKKLANEPNITKR